MRTRRGGQCINNLKQIGLAMHNYHARHKTFPPAYTVDKDGKPLLSWRVLILPYLEQDALYKEFHLDEPWDSEHNRALIDRMPTTYLCPGGSSKRADRGKTTYLTRAARRRSFRDPKASRSRRSPMGPRIRSSSSMPATIAP